MSHVRSSPTEADPCLIPFLSATDEVEQESLLESLISDQAGPLIRQIIGNRLRGRIADAPAGEDTYGEVILRLLKRLREFKANPDSEIIRNFRGYIAVTALNACHDYLRQKYPQRWSLENKLRYLLVHSEELALWQSDNSWLCGLAEWKDENAAKSFVSTANNQVNENLREFLPPDTSGIGPADLLAEVFNRIGHPVELSDLVTIMAGLWGIKDHPIDSYDGNDQLFQGIADPRPPSDTVLELRVSLQRLWKEICELPPRQRTALLLNLRDEHQRDIINLIPDTCTASFQDIAKTLNIPLEQFAQLSKKLPLDDATIAGLIGATPRQVIRLRKCARDRLSRRMGRL